MILTGKLHAQTPIYRGNARKTLFTRDGDGTQRLVSLAGEIEGTAQSLMDAFIGSSRDGRNVGLINQLWQRFYGSPLPNGLITRVLCTLQPDRYPRDHFFDLRMGIKLNEDRAAAEANANYKFETLFRNSVFDFSMEVNDKLLKEEKNSDKLYCVLQELREGRFWFGAGKSKGLGRCKLEMQIPFSPPSVAPAVQQDANHLCIVLKFDSTNPVLVGWNWGKVNPDIPAFAAIEGRMLVSAMKNLPASLRTRLERVLAGPILNPEDWKRKMAGYLPKVIALWLQERSLREIETWTIPSAALTKLSKGKHPLSKKVLKNLQSVVDQPFESKGTLQNRLTSALGENANMMDRLIKVAECKTQSSAQLDPLAWKELAEGLGLEEAPPENLAAAIQDEAALVAAFSVVIEPVLVRLYDLVDRQIRLVQSDSWVDMELVNREEHLRIKQMLLDGTITESQWKNPDQAPSGVSGSAWREFLDAHSKVQFRHLLHERNLRKSIANDQNVIAFLKSYRQKTRQELAQAEHIDFRPGGFRNREISQKYGKPYDTVFMRMLSWEPGDRSEGTWTVYIPGSTIKGAFRKRASQVLKTLWGETGKTERMLDRLFGRQGQRGLVFFSDAYLTDPHTDKPYWCAMDGVKMDPKTGRPIEEAKADYLFAYGPQLQFQMQLDLQDIGPRDQEAMLVFKHLINDYQNGDISLGGEKTVGFGWVQADIVQCTWLTGGSEEQEVHRMLFDRLPLSQAGHWKKLELSGADTAKIWSRPGFLKPEKPLSTEPPLADAGFISHRSFGGYCGTLVVEAEVLTPTSVRESGEPSFCATLPDGLVNGWDFFSMSHPEKAHRDNPKIYALPSKSLKGMIRHLYTIASNSIDPSPDLSRLNPTDSLFGWVGNGPNQAIMGRISVGFGIFASSSLAWFKVPYPYGNWKFQDGRWKQEEAGMADKRLIQKIWRIFPHLPLAPLVQRLDDFTPDTASAAYFRAMLPGAKARFSVRFWNLTAEELQRLIWCITLEPNLAHKIGRGRYLGFGSLQLRVLPESYLVDWSTRYAGEPETTWQKPFVADQWLNRDVIAHYHMLKQVLHVQ